jgi:hypothetical protein
MFRRYLTDDRDAKILRNPRSGIEDEGMKGALKVMLPHLSLS